MQKTQNLTGSGLEENKSNVQEASGRQVQKIMEYRTALEYYIDVDNWEQFVERVKIYFIANVIEVEK